MGKELGRYFEEENIEKETTLPAAMYTPIFRIKRTDREMFIDFAQPSMDNDQSLYVLSRIVLPIATAEELVENLNAALEDLKREQEKGKK